MRGVALAMALGWLAAAAPAAAEPSAEALWTAYKARFIAPEGRLVDDSQQSVSHSEGQGYAMLLAAFSGDRETFDRLWAWTRANLDVRPDGLAAWRWRPGDSPHALDKNNATDGDLLIAWALAAGAEQWSDGGLRKLAAKRARTIAGELTYASAFGLALSPGAAGFGASDGEDGPVVNLSYWVFPAFDALAGVAPDVDWNALRLSGLALTDAAKFGPRRLPADWISLKYGVQPAASFPKRFGYDALRMPLYLAWGAPMERSRLRGLVEAWEEGKEGPVAVVDLDSGKAVSPLRDSGYRAVAALARCAAYDVKFPDDLRWVNFDSYYSATLHMLSLTALRQRFPQC